LQIVSFRESKIPGSKSSGKFFSATVRSVVNEHFYVQFKGRDYINMNYPVPQDKQVSLWKHGVGAKEKLIGPDRMLDRRDESTRIVLDEAAVNSAVGFAAIAGGAVDSVVGFAAIALGDGGVAPLPLPRSTSPPPPPPRSTSPPLPPPDSPLSTSPPYVPTSPLDSPRKPHVPTSPPDSPRSPAASSLLPLRKTMKRSSDDSRIAEEALRAFKRPAAGGGGGDGGLPELKAGSLITLVDMWDKETKVMDLTPTPGVVTCVNRSTFEYRVLDKKAAAGSGKLLGAVVQYTSLELRNEVWDYGADFSGGVTEEQRAEFMAAVEGLDFH
jgi:hypothetical protein